VGDGNGLGEGPNHFCGVVRGEDLKQSALAELFVILQLLGKGLSPAADSHLE
jgi:hypothetical protein